MTCLFVEIVSLFTQNGKTVNGCIVWSFGVFYRCVAAANQCHVFCTRPHAQVFINIKIHYSQKFACWVHPKFKIKFRQDV